jgi:DNA modification methylase
MKLDDLPQPERVGTVAPDTLEVDGDNPNEQSDEMFGLLCENMRQKGWLGNHIICDSDGLIADGEHRWRAAQEIGLEEVPVKFYDIDDSERRLWRQELNKISGEHDTKRDALEYDYLLDSGKSDAVNDLVNATGEDLDELLQEIKVDNSKPPAYEYDPEHNVYFEDCVEGMQERLDDDSVDCVITDPPYGIDYDGKQKGTVENDGEDEALELLDNVAQQLSRVLKEDGHGYIFWTSRTIPKAHRILSNYLTIENVAVWYKNKSNILVSQDGQKYAYTYDPIFFVSNAEPRPLEGKPTELKDVFEVAKVHDFDHPTQKPTELITEFVENSTISNDVILDPFMGSGTTAVAAIQNDRDYVGFEVDEDNYRSVIERRIGEAKRQVAANED